MPINAPRGVTPSSPLDLAPIPMGVIEEKGGAGLMDLIKKLVNKEGLAEKVNPDFNREHFARDTIADMTWYLKKENLATEPGINVFPLGTGKGKQLIYTGPKGEVIGAAIVNELRDTPGKFFTSEFAVDKSKGLLAGKAAASLGKKLLEMGAADIHTPISSDTYRLLQHLAKLAGK